MVSADVPSAIATTPPTGVATNRAGGWRHSVKEAFRPFVGAAILRNAKTPLHRDAGGCVPTSTVCRVWDFTCARRNTQGVLGNGSSCPSNSFKKDRAMQWCLTEAHREESRHKLAMAVTITLMLPSFALLPHHTFRGHGFLARLRNGRRPNDHNNASLKTILHMRLRTTIGNRTKNEKNL